MIEQRRLPFRRVVAVCAGGDVVSCELPSMRIFVAILALGWRRFEIDIDQSGFEVGRLMTIDTADCLM